MIHIGLEIAFTLPDGTMCKVKSQTEDAKAVNHDQLLDLFIQARDRAIAVANLSTATA